MPFLSKWTPWCSKCEEKKLPATIKDNFLDPNKSLFCVRDHQIFLPRICPILGLCSCQISDHLNNSLWIRFEHLCQKQSFWDVLASRSQTKPEISPKIGARSKASMIRSQPYITLPLLVKKSGTSVDVKVDVKTWRRREGKDQAQFFMWIYIAGIGPMALW